ncbi:hypothetical protein TRICHSKD4_2008 [Roseibium sp. TrichSKD4]|nr:hypothetical protein TRICHSKD4_2008 [Roseibium sp. TrichSKD4]
MRLFRRGFVLSAQKVGPCNFGQLPVRFSKRKRTNWVLNDSTTQA